MPLVSKGRVGRHAQPGAAREERVSPASTSSAIQPIAEIFAVAVIAQQLQMALGKYRTMEAMSELTLSIAAEINSALQTIIGHCDLLERGYPDPNLQRDLATVVRQAQRIEELLGEDAARRRNERMREVEAAVTEAGIPSSPEAFDQTARNNR